MIWIYSLCGLKRDCWTTLFGMARVAIAHDFFFSFLPPCSLWSGQVGYRVFLVWLECTVYCTHSNCLSGFVIGPHVVAEYVARFNETRPVIVYAVWDPQPTSWFALRLTWDLTASRLVVRAWYALKMRFHITFYTTVEQ